MKLTLEHRTDLGTIHLEKEAPLAPWIVTLPCGFQFTCKSSKAVAIESAEQIMREST